LLHTLNLALFTTLVRAELEARHVILSWVKVDFLSPFYSVNQVFIGKENSSLIQG
jgi:hypothetical protein